MVYCNISAILVAIIKLKYLRKKTNNRKSALMSINYSLIKAE